MSEADEENAGTPVPISALAEVTWPAVPPPEFAQHLAVLHQLEQSERWSPAAILGHQLAQLEKLIDHAALTVPHYRATLAGHPALRTRPLTLAAWRALPILAKAEVQALGDALTSERPPPAHGPVSEDFTSGSTGRPLRVKASALATMIDRAVNLRRLFWHQRDFGAKAASIRSFPPGVAMPPAGARLPTWAPGYASGPLMVLNIRATIAEQLDWLDREQPAYLLVYPSVLRALAERCCARGRGLESLRGVTTFGEMLPADVAPLCERDLGVPLRDLYSAVEVGTIALQPRQGSHYLVQAERILVEILDADGAPCRPGTIGRVVATPLHNFSMPLVRYDLGDFAEAGGADPGGSGLPVLNRVMGRVRNLVTLPSGERIFPSFIHAVRAEPAVRQFQIVQKSRERLELRLAVAAPLDAAREEALAARLAQALGHRFALDFIYVESIAADPNGKYEDFKSELA